MSFKGFGTEGALLAGLALFAAAIIGAVLLLLGGRAAGGVQRSQKRAKGPPAPGEVSPTRHQNISGAPAR